MKKKIYRKAERYVPKYTNNIPFNIREELDILEERTLYDEWKCRDSIRKPLERKRIEYMKIKKKFIPFWRIKR